MNKKRNWTESEDRILKDLVTRHGKQWGFIATHLPNRSPSQVAARWEKCLDPTIKKGPFTSEEDQLVVNFVTQNGARSWPRITMVIPHRSAKQCRERWFNHLNPSVVKSEWTQEEDELIFQQHEKFGGKWSSIVKMFPGRTDNAIKNRWNSSVSKRIQEGVNGAKTIIPDSSNRKYRPRERPRPNIPDIQILQEIVPGKKRAPPPLQIPDLDVPSAVLSPSIPFAHFSLQTSNFAGDGALFSPISPISGFGTGMGQIGSPLKSGVFIFSPKRDDDDTFA